MVATRATATEVQEIKFAVRVSGINCGITGHALAQTLGNAHSAKRTALKWYRPRGQTRSLQIQHSSNTHTWGMEIRQTFLHSTAVGQHGTSQSASRSRNRISIPRDRPQKRQPRWQGGSPGLPRRNCGRTERGRMITENASSQNQGAMTLGKADNNDNALTTYISEAKIKYLSEDTVGKTSATRSRHPPRMEIRETHHASGTEGQHRPK